jgi:hypothetical protein
LLQARPGSRGARSLKRYKAGRLTYWCGRLEWAAYTFYIETVKEDGQAHSRAIFIAEPGIWLKESFQILLGGRLQNRNIFNCSVPHPSDFHAVVIVNQNVAHFPRLFRRKIRHVQET